MGKILLACEESQAVTIELRALGHEAYSCDLYECSGGHPEWHIQGDVTALLAEHWDMIIAFPPCTYLSGAGAIHYYGKKAKNVPERIEKGKSARDFFLLFYNADCEKVCVENPRPLKMFGLPAPSQVIQPYEHGHPVQKMTCLWLKGLPLLAPTNIVEGRQSTKIAGNWFNKGGKDRQRNRSKTWPGIAKAMAEQWGSLI
jgi:hypothetical protein